MLVIRIKLGPKASKLGNDTNAQNTLEADSSNWVVSNYPKVQKLTWAIMGQIGRLFEKWKSPLGKVNGSKV